MKNMTKRININLTDRELTALEHIKDEMATRGYSTNTSDIIRDAICAYCTQTTGTVFANEWKIKSQEENDNFLCF